MIEVCVVGGGPAGAALATRLAALGHDVAVVERHRLPRPHVGESLSPAAWPVLDALGVRGAVAAAGFTRAVQARVRWTGPQERVPAAGAGGLVVDRGRFDAILLERARAAGAAVLAGAAARRPARRGDGWEVPLERGALRARFLADASGRRRLSGGRRTPTSPRTLALHALWRGGPAPDGAQTWIEALAGAWLWGARLPAGEVRAMAFVDPEALMAEGADRERLYRGLLASSEAFCGLAASGRMVGPVRACDATSYAAAAPIDAHGVKVGEAAFAIDPLSSCGVQTAIQTGLAAAAAVHSILAPDGDGEAAMAFYREHQRHAVRRHAAIAAGVYAEHREHAGEAFWRRRAADAQAPAAPAAGPPLADLLPRRVRLAAGAALRDTPCLVGDGVQRRRALAHPALDRPVAYLGGSELAPLLDVLPASATLADAVRGWERRLAPGRGHEIARWLLARGVIEPAP